MEYSFSSDTNDISRKDLEITSEMTISFFGMPDDPEQFQATDENRNYIFNHLKKFLNIIRHNGKIIGYSFFVPSTNRIARLFLDKKISEDGMFEMVKKEGVGEDNFEAIYLCSAIVEPEHRGKGLALEASVKMIKSLMESRAIKPLLFFWGYTPEGRAVAHKVADATGLSIEERRD